VRLTYHLPEDEVRDSAYLDLRHILMGPSIRV
jgi:hypothetical protein